MFLVAQHLFINHHDCLLLQRIHDLDRHLAAFGAQDADRCQVLDDPVGLSGRDLLYCVTCNETNDLAARVLASLDTSRAVLQDEDVGGLVRELQLVESHAIARGVGLAIGNRLGGDQVLGDGEVEAAQPAVDEGLRPGRDNGPGRLEFDHAVEEGAGAGDLGSKVGVEDGELTFNLGDI